MLTFVINVLQIFRLTLVSYIKNEHNLGMHFSVIYGCYILSKLGIILNQSGLTRYTNSYTMMEEIRASVGEGFTFLSNIFESYGGTTTTTDLTNSMARGMKPTLC